MIRDIEMEIKVSLKNKDSLEKILNKNLEKKETVKVNQLQISDRSTLDVQCECDFCGAYYYSKRRNITTETTYCSKECRSKGSSAKKDSRHKKAREKIYDKLRERVNSGKSVLYKTFMEEDPLLLYSIERYCGNLTDACNHIGLSKEEMQKKYGFTHGINRSILNTDEIEERLLTLHNQGKLNTVGIRSSFSDNKLEVSMKKLFGSVEKGLEYYKLERDITDFSELIKGGLEFERVLKKIFQTLDVNYIYNRRIYDVYPDFRTCNNDTWVDAKLSSWTDSIERTIEKYTPYCNHLIIVYMRGKDRTDIEDNKVIFRNVDYYFPHLVNVGRIDLIEEIKELRLQFPS